MRVAIFATGHLGLASGITPGAAAAGPECCGSGRGHSPHG